MAAYMARYRRIAIRAGWGSGKSRALGEIVVIAAILGISVLWVTDTRSRLQTVVQPVCEELLAPLGFRYDTQRSRWVRGTVSIWLRPYYRPGTRAAESSNIEGANVGLCVVDECQVWRDDEVLRKLFGRSRVKSKLNEATVCIVMAGLPVYWAWWEEAARKLGPAAGCVIHGTSYDNRANLDPDWLFDAPQTLGAAEFRAMCLNEPRPVEGQIYDIWSPKAYPEGNIIHNWQWDPSMTTVWSVDFGRHRPAATLWAHDPQLGAWVLIAEVCPIKPSYTPELAVAMNRVAWPRQYADKCPPGVPYLFDAAVADPSGKNPGAGGKSTADLDDLEKRPIQLLPPGATVGGIGYRPEILTSRDRAYNDKVSVRAGIIRVRIAMEAQRLLCTHEAWQAGLEADAKQRSFARAIAGYKRDKLGDPVKGDGNDDICDTVRYLVRWNRVGLWTEHAFDNHRLPPDTGVVSSLAGWLDEDR